MTVDISKVFKANVKAIRVSLNESPDLKQNALNEELGLLRKEKKESQNKKNGDADLTRSIASKVAREARTIIQNITILKNFLLENKKAYIQPNHLLNDSDEMVQHDWQAYEDQAELIIRRTVDSIRSLKEKSLANATLSPQYKEHLESIFYLLNRYLKEVCNIYSEQKAIRVKKILDKKNFSQLCSSELRDNNKAINKSTNIQLNEEITSNKANNTDLSEKDFNKLTSQELMILENENDLIYDDLVSQSQEIKQIETEVIEVSKLTQIFAENIVSQFSTANSIHKSAVETNTNITTGNEDIKEAMKKNAALRLWILFIIVVLSFTLLFLDWYND